MLSCSLQQIIHGDYNEQNILCRKKPNSDEQEVQKCKIVKIKSIK